MSDQNVQAMQISGFRRPWTTSGGADRDFDEITRTVHQALLTDPNLLTCFRQRFPTCRDTDYDEMVRLLDYVWDCPHDGSANVTGYRCASCGRTRACAQTPTGPRTGDRRAA